MIQAIIFDWDGTLADTKSAVITSFQQVLREIDCDVSDRFIERRMGIGTSLTLVDALTANNIQFTEALIERLAKKKVTVQLQLAGKVKLFNGTYALLDTLKGRVHLALASMGNRKVIDKLLVEKGVKRYFDFVITASEVRKPKPHPEIFVKCADALNCSPKECVVIEDSLFGVKAAKEAKMKCVAVLTGAYTEQELETEHPNLIVKSVEEIGKILNFVFPYPNKTSNSE